MRRFGLGLQIPVQWRQLSGCEHRGAQIAHHDGLIVCPVHDPTKG